MREALEGRHPELTQNRFYTLNPMEKSFISSPFSTKYLSINSPCGLEEELCVLKGTYLTVRAIISLRPPTARRLFS
jgi:hypothetical protein